MISKAYDGAEQAGTLSAQEVSHGVTVPWQGSWVGVQRLAHGVWDDGDCYVIQGWRITDPGTLAQIGAVPDHETVLRFPKRMMQFFKEVANGGTAGL